jgi:hypothetical protein
MDFINIFSNTNDEANAERTRNDVLTGTPTLVSSNKTPGAQA